MQSTPFSWQTAGIMVLLLLLLAAACCCLLLLAAACCCLLLLAAACCCLPSPNHVAACNFLSFHHQLRHAVLLQSNHGRHSAGEHFVSKTSHKNFKFQNKTQNL
jgi:hypothetical protein